MRDEIEEMIRIEQSVRVSIFVQQCLCQEWVIRNNKKHLVRSESFFFQFGDDDRPIFSLIDVVRMRIHMHVPQMVILSL